MLAILKLYKRCRQFNALPKKGGVFDQDEYMMEVFEFIDGEVERWKAKRVEEMEGDLMKQKMLQGMPHG